MGWQATSRRARRLSRSMGSSVAHAYLLDVRRIHGLAPHLAVAAQDAAAQRVGHVVARLVRIDRLPVDGKIVEVPGGRVVCARAAAVALVGL
eukprot:4958643-Prymnesium_polylepis.1